jgi:inorganic pyrophosphatase
VPESFACIVEIPKGSRNKYEFDHERHVIKLDRFLFASVVYPTDYGFIPETLSQDGDPLDVMVCVSEPTFPGCMIVVKPLALFRMEDDQGVDDKVLAVPLTDPGWNTLESLEEVPDQLQSEIAHFFTVYKQLENKHVEVEGWYSREHAVKEIEASRRRYREDASHRRSSELGSGPGV